MSKWAESDGLKYRCKACEDHSKAREAQSEGTGQRRQRCTRCDTLLPKSEFLPPDAPRNGDRLRCTRANTQASHKRCNEKKNNRMPGPVVQLSVWLPDPYRPRPATLATVESGAFDTPSMAVLSTLILLTAG